MRRLRTVSLIIIAALFAVSCGGAGLPAPATQDPLSGQYIVNGGGGALDNVKALTDAFKSIHPNITWQGLAEVESSAGENPWISGGPILGTLGVALPNPEKPAARVVRLRFGRGGRPAAV